MADCVQDDTAGSINLRIQVLELLALGFKEVPFSAWAPKQKELVDAVLRATHDKYYRIASTALTACEQMILAMRPEPGSTGTYLHKKVPCLGDQSGTESSPSGHQTASDKIQLATGFNASELHGTLLRLWWQR